MVFICRAPYDETNRSVKEGVSPMHSSKPLSRGRIAGAATAGLVAMLSCSGATFAQTVQSQPLPEVKGAPEKTTQKNAAQTPAGGGDSAGLRQRVEQLEEQLVDLQVVIGTLESLARTGGATSAPARSEASGGVAASDKGRLDSIETQIRALTAQVEQLASDVRNGAQRRSDAAGAGSGFADAGPQTSRFGSTTVTSDNADPIGALAEANPGPESSPSTGAAAPSSRFGASPPGASSGAAPPTNVPGAAPPTTGSSAAPPTTYGSETLPPAGGGQMAAVDPASTGGNPKQLYETAYGHLLQQDYGAAQAGFRDFLKNYPQDPLAPNALYWLGEAHFVQRNYADAAEAFDLVISAYGTSGKAADAQLKRGMSLAQLGKRQDACTSLRAVTSKYPSAPAHLKAKADSERQRIGCP
jgi:tol-pal system protein YbgF